MEYDNARVELQAFRTETLKELIHAREVGKNDKDIKKRLDSINFIEKRLKISEKIKGSFFLGMFVAAVLILVINIISKF